MAATKIQFNITGVAFTPQGGSSSPITGVTAVNTSLGGSLAKFSGDGNLFPTTVINDYNDPTITINTSDMASILSHPPGTRGSLVYTYKDAKNATGGALTFTVNPAIVMNVDANQSHRQFGQSTVTFHTESTDGTTNPVSYVFA